VNGLTFDGEVSYECEHEEERLKAIAYRQGNDGPVFHTDCWTKFAQDYFTENGARAFLGTIYYSGAEREQLKGKSCSLCGFVFSADKTLRIKPSGHADNGWQHHFGKP